MPLSPNELQFWFVDVLNFSETAASWVARSVTVLALITLAWIANALARGIVLKLVRSFIQRYLA